MKIREIYSYCAISLSHFLSYQDSFNRGKFVVKRVFFLYFKTLKNIVFMRIIKN